MAGLAKHIIVALKGFGMGAANIVPGVSGGTIALLTGIFGELIEALNAFSGAGTWKLLLSGKLRDFWKKIHGNFLLALFAGVVLSLFTLAKLMEYVLLWYPVQTWAFFFGIIIASAIYMLADIRGWNFKNFLFLVLGGILGVLICTLSPTRTPEGLWFIFICGAIAICTMILPGVSGSFILVIFSKYEFIINALNTLNIPVLIAFAIGCVSGLLAFAKVLRWLLARYEIQTLLILIGFVLGSLVKVWPWNDMEAVTYANFLHSGMSPDTASVAVGQLVETGRNLRHIQGIDLHTPGAILWAILGLALVWGLETLGQKVKEKRCSW